MCQALAILLYLIVKQTGCCGLKSENIGMSLVLLLFPLGMAELP